MKKQLYNIACFLPFALVAFLILFLLLTLGASSMAVDAWLTLAGFLAAGCLLWKRHWWGCLLAFPSGIYFIVYGLTHTSAGDQPSLNIFCGAMILLYFAVCGGLLLPRKRA